MRLSADLRRVCLRRAPRLFARLCVADAHELGELGEELAVRALLADGFTIHGRRVRTAHAEVDVVAHDGSTLVCVEVKTTRVVLVPAPRGALNDPTLARFHRFGRLGSIQHARLLRAARSLARGTGLAPRVDLVEVFVRHGRGPTRIEHHRDVTAGRERPSRSDERDRERSV